MKTRKLRLLSFVLAVAMMFAIAPVSAFADSARTNICDVEGEKLKMDADGMPAIANMSDITTNYQAKNLKMQHR